MPPYIMVQHILQLPEQGCICVSPISCAAISYHSECTEKSSSRELLHWQSYGKRSEPPQIMSMPPRGRLFQMPLFSSSLMRYSMCGCMGVCICASASASYLKSERVKVGHSCQNKIVFSKQGLSLSQQSSLSLPWSQPNTCSFPWKGWEHRVRACILQIGCHSDVRPSLYLSQALHFSLISALSPKLKQSLFPLLPLSLLLREIHFQVSHFSISAQIVATEHIF